MELNNEEETEKKPVFTAKDNLIRMSVMIVLGAVSYALYLLGMIPGMQVKTIFLIEPSDIIIVLAYVLYGFFASTFVGLIKTGLVMTTYLSSVNTPIPVEHIMNFISSMVISLGLLIMDRSFRVFHKNVMSRILAYLFTAVLTTLVVVSLDYAFAVPIINNNYHWTTIYSSNVDAIMLSNPNLFLYPDSYGLSIIRLFAPYNLIKVLCVCLGYEIFFQQLVFKLLKSGFFETRYFMNRFDYQQPKILNDLKKSALESALVKETKEMRIEMLKKHNAKKVLEEEKESQPVHTAVTEYDYRYDLTIDNYGSVHDVSIVTDSESASVIVNYMLNVHPGSKYRIESYKEDGEITRDASSDGLSPELFYEVNDYDKEVTKILKVKIVICRTSTRKAAC